MTHATDERRTSNIERRTSKEAAAKVCDLEERLLEFAARVVRCAEALPRSRTGAHVGGQLLRCGTSPLLNHSEAESAASPQDFLHKMRICRRELRETAGCLKLIQHVPLVRNPTKLDPLLANADELVRIFARSVQTASRRVSSA